MFEDIYDDEEIEVVPSKKVGKQKTGSAYRRKMKRKHLEQVRKTPCIAIVDISIDQKQYMSIGTMKLAGLMKYRLFKQARPVMIERGVLNARIV